MIKVVFLVVYLSMVISDNCNTITINNLNNPKTKNKKNGGHSKSDFIRLEIIQISNLSIELTGWGKNLTEK